MSLSMSLLAQDVILYDGKLYQETRVEDLRKYPEFTVVCGESQTWGDLKKTLKQEVLLKVHPGAVLILTSNGKRIPLQSVSRDDDFNANEVLERVRKVGSDASYMEINELRDFEMHAPEKRGIKYIIVSVDDALPAKQVVELLAKLHAAKIKYAQYDTKLEFRRVEEPQPSASD